MQEEEVEIKSYTSPTDFSYGVSVKFPGNIELVYARKKLMEEIPRIVAERYVEEHFAEIAAKLDPTAITNLALAKAADAVAAEIRGLSSSIAQDKTRPYGTRLGR